MCLSVYSLSVSSSLSQQSDFVFHSFNSSVYLLLLLRLRLLLLLLLRSVNPPGTLPVLGFNESPLCCFTNISTKYMCRDDRNIDKEL